MIRRGLTLIEVMIATSILALFTVSCAPIIARSLEALKAELPSELYELSNVADEIISDPTSFGIDDWRDVTVMNVAPVSGSAIVSVRIELLNHRDPTATHAWVRVTEDESRSVYRWVGLPEAEGDQQP